MWCAFNCCCTPPVESLSGRPIPRHLSNIYVSGDVYDVICSTGIRSGLEWQHQSGLNVTVIFRKNGAVQSSKVCHSGVKACTLERNTTASAIHIINSNRVHFTQLPMDCVLSYQALYRTRCCPDSQRSQVGCAPLMPPSPYPKRDVPFSSISRACSRSVFPFVLPQARNVSPTPLRALPWRLHHIGDTNGRDGTFAFFQVSSSHQ